MMYVFLMLGMTLLGWLVRLMQALRLSVPLPVWGTGSYRVSSMVSGSHHAVGWYFLRTGGTCSIVLGGVPDPCGERNGSVTIRFGKIAKPYFLTTLLKSNNGFGEFTEPVVSYKPLLTRLSEAVLRLVRKG